MTGDINRKEFLKLTTGIITGLSIPGVFSQEADAAETKLPNGVMLDDAYLAKGLTAMARAQGWFEAHWGAGIIAGYYLLKNNRLDEETTLGIKRQMDVVIALRKEQFTPFPEQDAEPKHTEDILKALRPAMDDGLRAHGHAVIFASLSVRALREVPHMAQPAIIEKLCGLSRQISKLKPKLPSGTVKPYANTQAMIEANFDNLARYKALVGHPSIRRPNFTHMTTHTEALMNLEMMGYGDITKAGYLGHQAHLDEPVPEVDAKSDVTPDHASLEAVMSKNYWEDEENQKRWSHKWSEKDNPNGYWIAYGHLFKVLYSYHRLIRRIDDKEKVKLCSKVLLERYMNPEVQGG